ncbi:MAG TPA: PIN domain-containing protein [Thermomicrobiales bacterium]|nr:PIN domain-containing protein [Thermomicrobiales bacterium]
MRVALDTNLLIYAVGVNDLRKQELILELLAGIPPYDIVLSVQVLAEFYRVSTGKAGFSREEAAILTRSWRQRHTIVGTFDHVLDRSIDLALRHHFTIWDSIVVASSVEAKCKLLLSEDMHHGFTWSGVTIVDPFTEPKHPLLELALGGQAI